MNTMQIKIESGEGGRRLPVYLLLDCSGSMDGAPIEAVRRGIETFRDEATNDIQARDSIYVGIITFDSSARMVTGGLVPIDQFVPPQIDANGTTALGEAFRILNRSLENDVRKRSDSGKADWKPLVFVLTDGAPTDDWQQPRMELINRQNRKTVAVITVGCGNNIDESTLKAISIPDTNGMSYTFRMDNSQESFKQFFQWVSQSAAACSKSYSYGNTGSDTEPWFDGQTLPPDILQI